MTDGLPTLTLADLDRSIADFRARYPEPDYWIYGSSDVMPTGVESELFTRLLVAGDIHFEAGRWWWSIRTEWSLREAGVLVLKRDAFHAR